jgi:glycosyltransferase involved in cell wall biosynthesis
MDTKVSIFLMAYRMQDKILEALDGALAQTVPCEIIVSDDASEDLGYELAVARVAQYKGPHRVIVRRNEFNQGLCHHINTLASIATGDVFVFMSGDDVSYPDRVQKLLSAMQEHPEAYAFGSTVDEIDSEGTPLRRMVWGLKSPMSQSRFLYCGKFLTLLGASMAVRRELLIGLPPLQGMVEDNMLTLRASLFAPVYCVANPLLMYRRHDNNLGNWVSAREGDKRTARRRRYERTIRMYREIANDHERCVDSLPQLTKEKREIARKIISMYRLEADAREALLIKSRLEWLPFIYRGLVHAGLRRKSFERLIKTLLPRDFMGL